MENKYLNLTGAVYIISKIKTLLGDKSDKGHTHSKEEIGLGNVENKSSQTIRGELTSDNVIKALGYTPPKGRKLMNNINTNAQNERRDIMKGIDVSSYQGAIDWGKVKWAGVQFAILKIIRKDLNPDKTFEQNWKGCTEAGMPIQGVYNYSYAATAEKAKTDAQREGRCMMYIALLS